MKASREGIGTLGDAKHGKNIPKHFLARVGESSQLLISMLCECVVAVSGVAFEFYILVRFTALLRASERAERSAKVELMTHTRTDRHSAEEGKVEGGQTASKSGTFARLCISFPSLFTFIHCTHN